jgi:anaerobic magnesium-protoporphyrin IX monomethyl ester cyclase
MATDITFIFPRSSFLINDAVMPPLGILYLAAQLKADGYTVQCLDFGLGHTIDEVDSDIVGISFTTPHRFDAFKLAKQLKERGKTLIAGGAHASHCSIECLANGFDIAVRGEAEGIISKIVKDIRQKSFNSIYISAEKGVNELLFPDREAIDIKKYTYKIRNRLATVIMTSRSCPYQCTFCSKISHSFRMQSASRTVAEIFQLHDKYGFSAFMIFDDIFVADKRRLEKIVDLLKYENYLFRCFGRANLLTKEVCSLLKTMGTVEVGIGVESGSTHILKQNMKGTTKEMNTQAVKNLQQFGIRAKAFLIVGLPGESEETVKETKQWIETARPDDLDVSILQPMPGSVLFREPEKYGINFTYDSNPLWYKGKPSEYKSSFSTKDLSAERIVELRDEIESLYKDKTLLR